MMTMVQVLRHPGMLHWIAWQVAGLVGVLGVPLPRLCLAVGEALGVRGGPCVLLGEAEGPAGGLLTFLQVQ